MKEKTTFGVEPKQLKRLLLLGQEGPLEESEQASSWDVVAENPGTEIGRYRLLSILGEGGMGIVYLAEQTRPVKRKVALKIIKPCMDSKRILARFEMERQTLAMLDHISIAHMLDGGLTDRGRPYFVMEYVDGLPVTEYCDSHKLGIDERLGLFQQVCNAIQHAHQRGVIHRDIKPSNILVTSDQGNILLKVIDFGVARAIRQNIDNDIRLTKEEQLVGTPEYMSPEQLDIDGRNVNVQSDVYSLGVLLYVLLTGVLPFDQDRLQKGGIDTVRKLIKDQEPKTPSRKLTTLGIEAEVIAGKRCLNKQLLIRRLHRELEWIPLKAMAKDRDQRYRSAADLADDIRNYLEGRPLIAGPPSTSYHFKKFVRRNRVLVSALGAVAAAVIVGLMTTTAMYFRAEKALKMEAVAHANEQHQAQLTEAVSNFLTDSILGTILSYEEKGQDVTPLIVLNALSEQLEGQFENEPMVHSLIQRQLGTKYAALGEFGPAVKQQEIAYKINRDFLGEGHLDTANSLFELGRLYSDLGDYESAVPLIKRALESRRRILGEEHPKTLYAMNRLAFVYLILERHKEAEEVVMQVLRILRQRRDLGENAIVALHDIGMLHTLQWQFSSHAAEKVVAGWRNPELAVEWIHALSATNAKRTLTERGHVHYDNDNDKYTMTASGMDIYGLFDEFHYVHKVLSGDGSITARIDSIEFVRPWTKAGVMIRNNLSPTSIHASVVVTPERRIAFQYREADIGITHSIHTDPNTIEIPHWVRLIRQGDNFRAQHSQDGMEWEDVQSSVSNEPKLAEISMNESVYVGMVVSPHVPNRQAQAVLSEVRVTGAVSPPGPFTDSNDISLLKSPWPSK